LSDSNVPPVEMSGSMGPDEGFERLLRGETPKTPEERSLGLFLEDVRGAFPTEPSLQEGAQLAAIVQAAQLLADKGEPSVRYATEAGRRAKRASGRPKRRRVIVKLPLMRSLAAKVVAGLVVLMSMFGGLALAGALPGQGSDDDAVEIQNVSDEAPETEAPETEDADDQGEDADDQGVNEDADVDADDQGENEDADVDADDQDENEGADDQGENEDADDQGDDADDQGEDADDQGENEDQGEND
jgi:hypothetical protein